MSSQASSGPRGGEQPYGSPDTTMDDFPYDSSHDESPSREVRALSLNILKTKPKTTKGERHFPLISALIAYVLGRRRTSKETWTEA